MGSASPPRYESLIILQGFVFCWVLPARPRINDDGATRSCRICRCLTDLSFPVDEDDEDLDVLLTVLFFDQRCHVACVIQLGPSSMEQARRQNCLLRWAPCAIR